MESKFKRLSSLSISSCELILEREDLEIPHGYDQEIPGPHTRLILKTNDRVVICDNVHQFAEVPPSLNFPLERFAQAYPVELAVMIALFMGLPRPVKDNDLFRSMKATHDIELGAIEPRYSDGTLIWHEISRDEGDLLKVRRFDLICLRLVN